MKNYDLIVKITFLNENYIEKCFIFISRVHAVGVPDDN